MDSPEENNTTEKPADLFVQRDVLGLDKNASPHTGTKAKPSRIFIGLAIVIIIAIVFWLVKH
jgi:hypothetical protein